MPPKTEPEIALRAYLTEIQRNLASGIAREHTHRHALENLIEALDSTVDAFNDPEHIQVGAPDFTIRRKDREVPLSIGWIETKDIGEDLDAIAKSDQLGRYFGLPNLVLTDYLEFRWYVDGKQRLKARLATPGRKGKLLPDREGQRETLTLLSEFLSQAALVVATPKELAERMADLTHIIRDLLLNAFQSEKEHGHLHNQYQAFRETLIPDLDAGQFADMYAQTIAYGLFAARCQPGVTRKNFSRASAADLIPKTNPFLRKLFQSIAFDLDARVLPFVDDLVALLREADIGSIMADFGNRTAKEDPVVHFYEDFLKEYDPKVREMRGVYYTPEPVVSYIVRSVDYLLKTKFNKPDGLADKDVLILDPACGTGTFLYYVIRHIYDTLKAKGQKGQWSRYVSQNLLKRVFGFELLMAPYAVAHLKLGLLLQELGYEFDTDERLGVFLTNTLEEAVKRSEAMFAQWIADEANAAAEIKRDKPIMVVLGNPPYSGISANRGPWITNLIEDYRKVDGKPLGEKKVWLSDDYVKFIRFGQWRIERTGHGILAFITNHGYLDNPTFRGMRQSLMNSFPEIAVVNAHGNSKKKEKAPDGSDDKNVFDIQQGVAIGIFLKKTASDRPSVCHFDLWGGRERKYAWLVANTSATTERNEIIPSLPNYLFVPSRPVAKTDYEAFWKLDDVLTVNVSGVITARDQFAIDLDSHALLSRIRMFLDQELSDSQVRQSLELSENYAWRVSEARKQLRRDLEGLAPEKFLKTILYRPFDRRMIYFHPAVVWRTRQEVMQHVLHGRNLALLTTRQTKDKWDIFVTGNLAGHKSLSAYDITSLFPLYSYYPHAALTGEPQTERTYGRVSNLAMDFTSTLAGKLGVDTSRLDPENVFDYIYAVLNSPTYRQRYAEFLRVDFPRIPITSNWELFESLVEKGRELVSLHLMESPKLAAFITAYPADGDHLVEKVRYDDNHQRVYINNTQFFEGVPKNVWEFHIGGYQVCEKWLKDRKGRNLSSDDIDHYQKIVVALNETIRIMKEIDEIIPGWPLP